MLIITPCSTHTNNILKNLLLHKMLHNILIQEILETRKSKADLEGGAGGQLFPTEYTYHDTNQTDKAREQKSKREAAVIGELKRKYDC